MLFICHFSAADLSSSGLPWSGKNKNFQGQGKVREFFKNAGKIFDIGKVSEKSGNSIFRFIAYKFSAQFFNTFSSERD